MLDKIFSLFVKNSDPEAEKKRLLRLLAKDITRSRYGKFYRCKSEEVDVALGKFFYDIYKVVAPARAFVKNAEKSAQLKQVTIEYFIDKDLREIERRISPEFLTEQAKTVSSRELGRQLKHDLAMFSEAFDNERVNAIERCYSNIMAFARMVNFDYFTLLRCFSPTLKEADFSKEPQFERSLGSRISRQLKEFLEASYEMDPSADWKTVPDVLNEYKGGLEIMKRKQWKTLLLHIQDIQRSSILIFIIRYIDKDPGWVLNITSEDTSIVKNYLEAKRAGSQTCIERVFNTRRNFQIEKLAIMIFGVVDVSKLNHYSEKNNEAYLAKGLAGFEYAVAMNYLAAFLLDYYQQDIKVLCELFLLQGQWTALSLSQRMSELHHSLLDILAQILAFDAALDRGGVAEQKLKQAAVKDDRKKRQGRHLAEALAGINEDARGLINNAALTLIALGAQIRDLAEDYDKDPHECIVNWEEIESAYSLSIRHHINDIYTMIYNIVWVLKLCIQPIEEK
jgi:hypothetical protein